MRCTVFRRIIAMMLVCTLLAGQFLIGGAYAADGITAEDDSSMLIIGQDEGASSDTGNVVYDPATGLPIVGIQGGTEEPGAGEGGGNQTGMDTGLPDDLFIVDPILVDTGDEENQDPNNLTVRVMVSQQTFEHGDTFSFRVSIVDVDTDTPVNLSPGGKISINVPDFVDITQQDINNQVKQNANIFADGEISGHTILLTVKASDENTDSTNWSNMEFNITGTVKTIGYDGGGRSDITVNVGGVNQDTVTGSGNVNVDVGIGDGTGDGDGDDGEVTEVNINKDIFSNESQTNPGVADDSTAAIGYSVKFNVNLAKHQSATVYDNLAEGNLILCDAKANTDIDLGSCFKLYLNGSRINHTGSDANSVTYANISLGTGEFGTVTITKGNPGFTVSCTGVDGNMLDENVNVPVTYFAKLTPDTNVKYAKNDVTLTLKNGKFYKDEETIRRYGGAAMIGSKRILVNGEE